MHRSRRVIFAAIAVPVVLASCLALAHLVNPAGRFHGAVSRTIALVGRWLDRATTSVVAPRHTNSNPPLAIMPPVLCPRVVGALPAHAVAAPPCRIPMRLVPHHLPPMLCVTLIGHAANTPGCGAATCPAPQGTLLIAQRASPPACTFVRRGVIPIRTPMYASGMPFKGTVSDNPHDAIPIKLHREIEEGHA